MTRLAALAFSILLCSTTLQGESALRIAVASNFHHTLDSLARSFEAGHPDTRITLIPGSSGKLYAQIAQGAAFDAFFSADAARPRRLEDAGIARPGSRFTFALGVLAFWQPQRAPARFAQTRILARANPQLAPFGTAAAEAQAKLSLPASRIVTASSVSQAFTFAQSGAADSAFVSYSQLLQQGIAAEAFILVDPQLYAPIAQQAVALSDDPLLVDFLAFCQGAEARSIIAAAGYRLP